MANLRRDIRFALRTLTKSPVFVVVAVLSLALGIGANTAIFTLVDQVLLRLLPVKNPQQLVLLTGRGRHYGSNNGPNKLSYPMYADFRDHNQVFSGMFARNGLDLSLNFEGRTEAVSGEIVSGNYFPVLGVGAAIGRVFTADDDLYQGQHPIAVISYDYWVTRFARDPGVIGKKLFLNGYPFTVIGVSQAGFRGIDPAYSPQIRVPMMMKRQLDGAASFYSLNDRRGRWINVFGRLRPGVAIEQAKASLQPFFHQMLAMEVRDKAFAHAAPSTKQDFLKMWIDVLPAAKGRSQLRERFSKPLLVLTAIVGLVLLIACANVANLLIARATARQKEIALRLALGAGRRQIVSQLLVESMIIALAGGIGGLALAVWIDRTLIRFLPTGDLPLAISSTPDWRILGFNMGISLIAALVFGLVPALQATRPNLASTLKEQAGAVIGGGSVAFRKVLVIGQVALSLLLLIGAGLFIQSLRNLRDLDPGFHTRNLLSFYVDAPSNGYPSGRSLQFYRQLNESLNSLPGVESASLAIMPVLEGDEWDSSMTPESDSAKPGEPAQPHMNFVAPGYFKTLDVPILVGRDFNARDEEGAPKVAIVNEKFAKRYFGSTNAVGRRIGMGGDPGTKTDITIVGVTRDMKYEDMRTEMPIEVFLPYRQVKWVLGMNAYVRTARDPNTTFNMLRQTVRQLDPNLPVSHMITIEKQLDNSLVTERLVASLSAAFGFLATLLAAIGLYGVMAYMVARRTREIGIRMALGAWSSAVLWIVMREVLALAAIGIAIALPVSWALTRLIQSQLYGITPNDPLTIVSATAGIALIAILAGHIPARRATLVDPMLALRYE